jgi:cytochrome P450
LPYIEAIYREVFRYEPPLGIGIPHSLVEDDVVGGYFLPKGLCILSDSGTTYEAAMLGTMVSSNIWAMTHDENLYPDPFSFKPERFLNADGTLNDDNRILAYGFGRRLAFSEPTIDKVECSLHLACDRICVGKAVASDVVGIFFTSCHWRQRHMIPDVAHHGILPRMFQYW